MTGTHQLTPAAVLALGMWLAACGSSDGGSSGGTAGCGSDADCTANGWCQAGTCQAAYVLTVNTLPAAGPDAKVHANGVVRLSVGVTGGGTASAPAVMLSFPDEGRLQVVSPPDYVYAWDTRTSTEGSHRVKATVSAGSRSYESPVVEVVVDWTKPAAPVVAAIPTPTNARDITATGTAEAGSSVEVTVNGAPVPGTAIATGGAWSKALSFPASGTYVVRATATDEAGNRSDESAPRTVVVDQRVLTAPTLVVRSPTNASPVPASGVTLADVTVSVYEGVTLLAQAVSDAQGAWSAALALAEGTHVLRANATNGVTTSDYSPDLPVTVDRTAPQVARTPADALVVTPAPGAQNVWSRSPITVTFTEPMLASSAVDAALLLAGRGGSAIAKTLSLSAGGTVLTVVPASLPDAPNDLTLTLGTGLTDLAGNPLSPPAPWTWSIPAWQEPADPVMLVGNSSNYFLGMDRAGNPTVAVTDFNSGTSRLVLQWDGLAYAPLAPPAMSNPAYLRGLDVDPDGRPVVAWREGAGANLHAARWNGSSWEGGATPLVTGYYGGAVPLRFEPGASAPRPVVAWSDGSAIHARRLEGASWQALGTAITVGGTVGAVVTAFDPSGNPRVGWMEARTGPAATYFVVRTLDGPGGSWTSREWLVPAAIADGAATSRDQNDGSIQIDPSGRPVIAWLDGSTPHRLFVSRVSAGNESWQDMGVGSLNVDPAADVYQSGCQATALGMDASGVPVVAWFENGATSRALYARRWRDPTWEPLGDTINSQGNLWAPCGPRVSLSREGIVGVIWWESYLGVKGKRYNR